jgi:hypothetical protein
VKSLLVRFRAAAITFALAAAGVLGVGAITAPEALAACTGSIVYNQSSTTVTNTSQCYEVRASIEGYASGGSATTFYGAIASNKSTVNLPGGTIYIRNGMGLHGSPSASWSWSYYVY